MKFDLNAKDIHVNAKTYDQKGILICEILGNILDLEEGSRTLKSQITEKICELQELYRVG